MIKPCLSLLIIFFSTTALAYEESYNRSMDHIAKTRFDYSTYDPTLQVETEILQYDADFGANRKGLDYLRTNFMKFLDENNTLEVEVQSFRDGEEIDAQTMNSVVRHRRRLYQWGNLNFAFQTQLTTPVNSENLHYEGVRPGLGVAIDFFHYDRFAAGIKPTLEFSKGLGMEEWDQKLILDWYLSYQFTHRLGSSVSLYAERPEAADSFSYSELSFSVFYQLTQNIKLNMGTWVGGEPTQLVYNNLLAASLVF